MTDLKEILASVDGSLASYSGAANAIGRLENSGLSPVRLGILASFTVDFLRSYLIVEAARRGIRLELFIGPFGQIEQQVLNADSDLLRFRPDIVFLSMAIEDVAPQLCDGFLSLTGEEVPEQISAVEVRIRSAVEALRDRSAARIMVANFSRRGEPAAGYADALLSPGQEETLAEINRRMAAICRSISDAYIVDIASLMHDIGRNNWTDKRLQYFARAPLSTTAMRALAIRLARQMAAFTPNPRKCLVLDLDNTLWGGVLGEDGLEGIKLGEEWPGNAFKAFQRACLALRARGILLAVASKNDEALALEALNQHPDCLIRPEHLSSYRINWNDKAASLREISAELNIGLDTLVFFDDNPVERDWIRQSCPEVLVIDVPSDPIKYVAALEESGAFDRMVLTADDRLRAAMYTAEAHRKVLVKATASMEDFLRQLEMKVKLGPIRDDALPRVAQLIAKTNQFNLTGRRRSAADLKASLKAGGVGLWIRAEDRFGDNGLVGVGLAVPEDGGSWRLDLFLLSCRVIGRKIENTLLTVIAEMVWSRGGRRIVGEYIPTARNTIAANFFSDAGFARLPDGRWMLDISSGAPRRSDQIVIEVEQPDYV